MKLHEWIKEYRKNHGLSMQALADMCGFSKAYIGILEKGINPTTQKPISPTMQTLQKIADGVGIDINDFIKILDDDQPVTVNPAPTPTKEPLSAHEKAMVDAYHKAPDNIQNVVNVALNSYSDEDLPALAEKEKGETDIHSVG
jgi:transcriptional regulator with XRE-family HTH domain